MPRRHLRAILATTHPVESYGGVQFGRDAMQAFADAVRSGAVPMHVNHDYTRPVDATVIDTGVEERDDGHCAAWALLELDEGTWAAWQAELAAAGAPGGWSFTVTEPIGAGERTAGYVAGDAAHFSDEDLRTAAETLSRIEPMHARRLYQFSEVPDAVAVLGLSLHLVQQLGPNLLASALWDGVKALCQSRLGLGQSTRVALAVSDPAGQRVATLTVDARDEATLRTAMQLAPDVIAAMRCDLVYDEEVGHYRRTNKRASG